MNHTAEVLLTINLEGAHKPRFVEEKGKQVRIFTEPCEEQRCVRVIKLSNQFVLNSIKSKPDNISPFQWKKMSIEERVKMHMYALALEYGGKSFTFSVNEDELNS